MQNITLKELFMSAEELSALESEVAAGNFDAQFKLLLYYIYGPTPASANEIFKHVTQLCENGNPMALAYAGFLYEHALGVKKDYCKAVEYYSKAYDAGSAPAATKRTVSAPKTEAELGKMYSAICKEISRIVNLPAFCVFEKDAYHISLNQKSIKVYEATMPALISQIDEFQASLESAMPGMSEEDAAQWEYRLQDTVLVPLEIFKTILIRYFLRYYLESNDFVCISEDEYFSNAIGRCIVDDDETDDNDYIIGGLLQMAGHDESPLWQYRVGLWFENSDRNLEPLTAADWYAKAQRKLPAAKAALKRVKKSQSYQILQGRGNGTVKECQELSNRTSVNPQNSILWLVESAIRGDGAALMRLEQKHISPTGGDAVLRGEFKPDPYYKVIAEETRKDEVISDSFFADKLEESKKRKKLIELQRAREEAARKKAEEEARRKEEAKRQAEQEAIRRAEEEARRKEEEKRQAELEAIRKIEEEKRQAELAEKRKEAARKRAETLARKKEEERIQAEQEAKRKAEEEKRKAEEERQRAEEACKRLIAVTESLKDRKVEILAEFKSECESKCTGLENSLASAYRSLSSKLEAYRPKIWHKLFCSAADKDIDDFLRKEKSTNSDLISKLQTEIADAKAVAKKIDNLLRKPAEMNETALKAYVTKLKKQIDELSDAKDSCKKQIKAVEKQITHLSSEISYSDFKCEFYFLKTLFVLSVLWAIVSLIRIFFTDSVGPFIQLIISVGVAGSAISLDNSDKRSFKDAFNGFAAGSVSTMVVGVLIMLLISWVGSWFDGSESEEEYGDSASLVEEEYARAFDHAEQDMARALEDAGNAVNSTSRGGSLTISYTSDGKYGLLDKSQNVVVPFIYDYIYSQDSDTGLYKVELKGKYGYLDKNGKEFIKVKYDYIYSPEDNGWRKVELKDKYGFVDASGKEIVTPKYDYIYSEDENGWRKVEVGDKLGYINASGAEIVSPVYDYIYSWSGGLAKVEKGNKIGYIDRSGKLVKPLE